MTQMADIATDRDRSIDVVARTIWGEARGGDGSPGMEDNIEGMIAVACVIANRVARPGWWGKGWSGVCLKPWQFSCWNRNDPNRQKLLSVDPSDAMFNQAKLIATRAVDGELEDVTDGATHYHTKAVEPAWMASMEQTAEIGHHLFYKEA